MKPLTWVLDLVIWVLMALLVVMVVGGVYISLVRPYLVGIGYLEPLPSVLGEYDPWAELRDAEHVEIRIYAAGQVIEEVVVSGEWEVTFNEVVERSWSEGRGR